MTVYVNSKNEIKSVGVASDSTLTPIEITDGTFDGWSDGKICCYKISVVDGKVTMLTPYVDSRMIDHFDGVSRQTATNANDIADNREGIMETFEQTMENGTELEDVRSAIIELYEMLEG